MKLWLKVYMVVMAVAFLLINIVAALMLVQSQNQALDQEISSAFSDHQMISDTVAASMAVFDEQNPLNAIDNAIRVATRFSSHTDIKLDITTQNEAVLYSTLDLDVKKEIMTAVHRSGALERTVYVVVNEPTPSVGVYGTFMFNNEQYSLVYTRDISSLYRQTERQAQRVFFIMIAAMVVCGVMLFYLIRIVMRPMARLAEMTQRMAQGQYDVRNDVHSGDEVGHLAENFNTMADAVQYHIGNLSQMVSAQKDFISNFAHELKTPLAVVIGNAELMQMLPMTPQESEKRLRAITTHAQSIETLSLKLMDIMALESGGRSVNYIQMEPIELTALFTQVQEAMASRLDKRKQALVVSSQNLVISADRTLMVSLFANLIDNASKASKEGDVIYLEASRNDGFIVVSVIDSGIGMTKEEISRVKEPFYMADKSRSRATNGIGLGLSLCNTIAEAHDAKLQIISTVQKGTTVSVFFPAGAAAEGPMKGERS
ncbi:MAG: ATP-binding protein [Christensenellales bacterium]|jgi:signal transduction histidine kinase